MARLAVCDLRHGISILDGNPPGPPMNVPAASGFGLPYGLARLTDGRLLTADRSQGRVIACAEDGTGWQSFGSPGAGPGEFNEPMGVAVADDGRIFVADTGNCRIVQLDSLDGVGWQSYGRKIASGATGAGTFAHPIAIQHGPNGLVVADPGAARIVQLAELDDASWDESPPGVFANPVSVAILSDGTIVVGDLTREGLALMDAPSTGVVKTISDSLLRYPAAITATGPYALTVCCFPTLALCSVEPEGAGWKVTLDAKLDQLGLRRPTALWQLP